MMKKVAIMLMFGLLVHEVSGQSKKDTLVVITRDTTRMADKKTTTIDVEISRDTTKMADKKTATIGVEITETDTVKKEFKPSSRFSFEFVASRVDIGLSTYTDKGSFTLSPQNAYLEREFWKSSNFGFEFFQFGYRFNSYVKLYAAAGLDWNHMRLERNITFQKDQPTLTYVNENVEFSKNRFSSQYLRIPLAIQLRTKDDPKGKKLNFVFGPEVGFLITGKIKQVSEETGKNKYKDDYNFNPVRYGAFARLGYGGCGVYVKYYGNDVFADGQGPLNFKNLSMGLMFGF